MIDIHRRETAAGKKTSNGSIVARYLDGACRRSPVISETLLRSGRLSLSRYLDRIEPVRTTPLQPPGSLLEALHRYVSPLLGEEIARSVSRDLAESPVVLTANHHGVDFFSQSVQGSLLFSCFKSRSGTTVPVFACGSIPLDNLTYPMGLLLYAVPGRNLESIPKKLPVFSNKYRRTMVNVSVPYDAAMVQRALARAEKMAEEEEIAPHLKTALQQIFMEDYGFPAVLSQPLYSNQSVILNHRIWKRLFNGSSGPPELVYLELERVVQMLLEADLKDPESLAWQVLFNPTLREAVLETLEGAQACWEQDKLRQRGSDGPLQRDLNGCGTLFFWGINKTGRKVPLCLGKGGRKLAGVDDRGDSFELSFTPEAILSALHQSSLLPSLFTSFLVLSFARGLTCAGGYYQGEYLPGMQQGLVSALRQTAGFSDAADRVQAVAAYTYLSGMQMVMTRVDGSALVPAGPVEIMAGGGLTAEDIDRMLAMTVEDAHIASLIETVPDIAPGAIDSSDWKVKLAEEVDRLLADTVVVK